MALNVNNVNVFGKQLGATDLMSAADRLAALNNSIQNGMAFTQPDALIDIQNQSRFGNEAGAPNYLDNSPTISGGSPNSPGVEFDIGSKSLATVRNRATIGEREKQQWASIQAASVRRKTLGQNDQFTPEVQEWRQSQIDLTGQDPIANLTDEQIDAAMQTGVVSVPGGIQHLTAEEQMSGKKAGLPVKRGDLARFFSPDNDAETIVGQANSSDPATIPVGVGGINFRQSTNRGGNLGAWTQMERNLVVNKVEWLRTVRDQVESALYSASIDRTNGQMSELGKIFEKEFGVGAATNPSVAGIVTAAYYSALNESRFAKYSQEDIQNQEKYRDDNDGRNDPDLWSTNEYGKEAQTPMLRVLTEAIGSSMESVGTFKFSSPEVRNLMGDVVRKTFSNLGSGVSLTSNKTQYMGEDTGPRMKTFSLEEINNGDATGFSPVRGISFEKTMGKKQLGEIMGIINALQPGKRKNAHYSPPPEIALDKRDPQAATSIRGKSSVRNSFLNIVQSMPNKLDPYTMNILASLIYKGPQWNHIVAKILKIEEAQVNIMLQQYTDVKNNGGIFYQNYMQQASGRHAAEALAGMQNLNGQRVATIPPTPELMALSKETNPDKYSKAEADFVAASMTQLGYNNWGDKLQGNDNLRYSSILRRFKQLLDPKHPIRAFQEKMLAYEQALRGEKGALPETFGIDYTDGLEFLTDKDSLQALWSLNEFLKAKEAGKNEFLDPYVTGIDSQQNGLFGIGVNMGDIASTKSGGARTKGSNSDFFKDETGLLENDKTYMTTLGMARSLFLSKIREDKSLSDFSELFFINANPEKELDNLFQKEFSKKVVVGGQYGEKGFSSARSMRTGFLEWLEKIDNPVSEIKVRDDVMASINEWGGVGGADVNYFNRKSTQSNIDDPVPIIYFKRNPNDNRATNKIQITGAAFKEMNKIAEIFNFAMHKAAPVIADYTSKMSDIYTTMVELAGYSQDNELDLINGVELTILEPDVTDSNKSIYNNNGYANDWKPGLRINLLDSMVEDKWVSYPLQGWIINNETNLIDDAAWEDRKVWLRTPSNSYDRDLKQEREALDFNNPIRPRSAGITRFPVASLHVLDDLAMAITVHELKRKYGNEFDWFNSVWDEGKVRKQFRERFADEYNKAWMAVLISNNYFKNMSKAFKTAFDNIPPEHMAKINKDKRAVETYEILKEKIDQLVHQADEILTGNHQRGNVHKITQNYDKHNIQNMAANTRDTEGHQTKINGNRVQQPKTYEYQNRNEAGKFAESALKGLHPGMFSNGSIKDKNAYLASLKKK